MLAGDDDRQARVLRYLTTMQLLRAEWGGSLVLSVGLTAEGADLALAANIAGAVCLAIDPDAEHCRAALRTGACDFAVNTVDEALRVMKNEIRKRQPLSVALELEIQPALAELIERGVLPQVFANFSADAAACSLGSDAYGPMQVDFEHNSLVVDYLVTEGLIQAALVFDVSATLRAFDAAALALMPEGDPRRRWLAIASRHFHRERPPRRELFLTRAECEELKRDFPGANLVVR